MDASLHLAGGIHFFDENIYDRNQISVPLQSSPGKIYVIFQSGPYKSSAGPNQKHMELPAQI